MPDSLRGFNLLNISNAFSCFIYIHCSFLFHVANSGALVPWPCAAEAEVSLKCQDVKPFLAARVHTLLDMSIISQ